MLKKLKKQDFLSHFFIDGISIEVVRAPYPPPPPPPGYAYDFDFNAICDNKILCAFLLVRPCVHAKGHQWFYFV